MSTSPATGGAPFSSGDDRVYRAVAAGGSVDEVRRAIERSRSSAGVDQASANGETPLRAARRLYREDLVCLLLENGAEAGDGDCYLAVCWCVGRNDLAALRRLIERGVSVNTVNEDGWTPLMQACLDSHYPDRRVMMLEIFRRSSAETWRAICEAYGWSAIESIVANHPSQIQPWQAELRPREAELAPLAHSWRAHEALVGLALDVSDMREAERELLERRARLEALERELGSGTGSSGGSEGESEGEVGRRRRRRRLTI